MTTPPATIRLWFSERIQLAVSSVRLTDAAGHAIATGRLAAAASASAPVVADVKARLPAGRYIVTWRVLARDGHVANGHFSFTVAAPASH